MKMVIFHSFLYVYQRVMIEFAAVGSMTVSKRFLIFYLFFGVFWFWWFFNFSPDPGQTCLNMTLTGTQNVKKLWVLEIFNLFLFVFENQDRTCLIFYLLQDDSLSLSIYIYIYIYVSTHMTYIYIYMYTYIHTFNLENLAFRIFRFNWSAGDLLSRQEMLTWQSPSTLLRPHLWRDRAVK